MLRVLSGTGVGAVVGVFLAYAALVCCGSIYGGTTAEWGYVSGAIIAALYGIPFAIAFGTIFGMGAGSIFGALGALLAAERSRIDNQHGDFHQSIAQNPRPNIRIRAAGILIGLALVPITGFGILSVADRAFSSSTIETQILHGATWTINPMPQDGIMNPTCISTLVLVDLVAYDNDGIYMCSDRIANYLETYNGDVIPITYRVRYNTDGSLRSYWPLSIGNYPVRSSEYVGDMPGGCVREGFVHPDNPRHPCFYESTWPDGVPVQ